jgi:hypothetical protein
MGLRETIAIGITFLSYGTTLRGIHVECTTDSRITDELNKVDLIVSSR